MYLLIFIVFYFILEKFFLWKIILKWKRHKIIDNFIFGFFLGIITLISQLINIVIFNGFQILLFISTMILLSIFKEYSIALFSMIPGFIYNLFSDYNNASIYVNISLPLFAVLIMFYLKIFFSKKWKSFYIFLLLMCSFFISFSIGIYDIYYYDTKSTLENISYIYILTLFGYWIMNYIIKFTISSKILYESSRYTFLNFYRPFIATRSINDFLFEKKIQYGYLVLFQLKYNAEYLKLIEKNINMDIEKHYYKLLQQIIDTKGILFNYDGNQNGFFIPAKKEDAKNQKIFNNFYNAIKMLNKKYFWQENEIPLKMTASFGISKYGIDSQNINRLIHYSAFALNEQPQNINQITFFNKDIYRSFLEDNYNVNHLDAVIQLDNLSNSFTPLYDLGQKDNFATYIEVENISEFQTYETIRENIYVKNFHNTFDRYFASFAILESNNNKIIIHYAPTIFENNFIIERFCDFFKRNKIQYSSIFLIFDKQGINKIKDFTVVKENINKIQKLGIKIIIPNNSSKSKITKILDNVEYSFINSSELNKFKNNYNCKIICYDLKTQNDILKAFMNKIKILGGPIFENKLNFIKFSKQSKIYLEQITKGVINE